MRLAGSRYTRGGLGPHAAPILQLGALFFLSSRRWVVVHSSNDYGRFLSTGVPHPATRFRDSFQLPALQSSLYEEKCVEARLPLQGSAHPTLVAHRSF